MTQSLLARTDSIAVNRPRAEYRARIASCPSDLQAAQALRFAVFNLELDEGLAQSYDTGLDVDPFDAVCDHLIVEDLHCGDVVGTYRMQTGSCASASLGYYCEREFDLAPMEAFRASMLELGRACVHRQHRNFTVLNLLWKGILTYAHAHGARYLIGCSSLTLQDSALGAAAYARLEQHLAPPQWRTQPQSRYVCALHPRAATPPKIPRLLSAYLALGAAICGPPAIDREFKTIDFLTWLDIQSPALVAMQRRGRFGAMDARL